MQSMDLAPIRPIRPYKGLVELLEQSRIHSSILIASMKSVMRVVLIQQDQINQT